MRNKFLWILFVVLAIAIGLYPLIYFLVDREFGLLSSKDERLLNNVAWNLAFYVHIILGGLSLLLGWTQFSAKVRSSHTALHRQVGKLYVMCALISAVSGLYIPFFATGGWVTAVGFICLGCIWFFTTFKAFTEVKQGRIDQHEKLMIFSYAACFAAVTLRIWLPLLIMLFGDFNSAYRLVAWLCWVPNLLIAFLISKRSGQSSKNLIGQHQAEPEVF